MIKDLAIRCACYSAEHTLQFLFDEDENEIYTEVLLRQYRSFPKRVWVAIKYILGYKCRFGHFDCFEMSPEAAEKLVEALREYLENIRKKENG